MTDSGGNVGRLMKKRIPANAFTLLQEAGRLGDRLAVPVYVVGGSVRDLLLGIRNLDLDLAVEGDGVAFARALARDKKASAKVYERFSTAMLFFPDGGKLDVATTRAESYQVPAALPVVAPSGIKDDLFRRDFTINALAVRLNGKSFGELIDFYGGRRDLKGKTIRVLHSRSFIEDPTRIFRAVRFEQRFGFALHRDTLARLRDTADMDLVGRLSGHRLLNEVVLLLSEKQPRRAIARLGELGLLRFIHPHLTWSSHLKILLKAVDRALERYQRLCPDRTPDRWLVYFMAMLDRLTGEEVEEALARLPVRARHAEAVRTGHASLPRILRRLARHPPPTPGETHRLLSGLSEEALLLLMARTPSDAGRRRLSAFLTRDRHVKPSVGGSDLKDLGLKPGPRFKEILERLLEARLNGEITTEAEERVLAKHLVGA
jgi:tRNA nucleotidyltransferase (CCA-adding enzyme)